MACKNTHFKRVLDFLDITNKEIAKELDIDPSLISRYASGNRMLKASSAQMNDIADFIIAKGSRVEDVEWLKKQFYADGLPTDVSTVRRLKQCLILWLAADGDKLRQNLGRSISGDIAGKTPPSITASSTVPASVNDDVKIGELQIVLELKRAFSLLADNTVVEMFLSSDQIMSAVTDDFSSLLIEAAQKHSIEFRMVVCVTDNTQAISSLINSYMSALVSGHIKLSIVHGMTQSVTNTMHIIVPNIYAMLITETGKTAPAIATVIRNVDFVAETAQSFDIAAKYSQPVLNIYDDNFSRNILELIYFEFCTPGSLDVIKDSINPMYMTSEAYDRFLAVCGHSGEEYRWRSDEYVRFKSGLDETLRGGAHFREIISLKRLNSIVIDGYCRMAGTYFMNLGYVNLDAVGCLSILEGYVRYLETYSNFELLILDDLSSLHSDNCWQLKENHHIVINYWENDEPVMIHSDQLMLLREFQTHFERLWEHGMGAVGSRANVIDILRDVIKRLKKRNEDMGNI